MTSTATITYIYDDGSYESEEIYLLREITTKKKIYRLGS